MRYLSALLLIYVLNLPAKVVAQSKNPKGTLFIIGGGSVSDSLRMDLIRSANWKKGDAIAVVTLASGLGDEAFNGANAAFKKLTGTDCIKFDSAAVHDQAKLDSLSTAKIIYLGGGSQDRFMQLIKGSNVAAIIHKAYRGGALIGGTSAGAAVMSKKMLTGYGLVDTVYAPTFKMIRKGNIEIMEGLGLLDSVIIDQHFLIRSRHNRMLSAVMEFPGFQCIGIDESTAIVIKEGVATVAGSSQVIVFEDARNTHTDKNNLLAASSIKLAVFIAGEKFRIKK